MDLKHCWDCPVEAWILAIEFAFLVIATWLAVWLTRWNARLPRIVRRAAIVFVVAGSLLWVLNAIYVPRWGIRLYDTPADSAVLYGPAAFTPMLASAFVLLANLAAAYFVGRRRGVTPA